MSNTITVNFIPCSPTPGNGYKLTWRVAGSGDPYTDEGFFTSSPAQFTDVINPEGTCYEGFLQSDCESAVLGAAVPWATPCEESGVSNYTISLDSPNPCFGASSATYLVEGGTIGDVVTVRASFAGLLQRTGNTRTEAVVSIFAVNGTSDTTYTACYSDTSPHGFSITADTVITMTVATEMLTVSALAHNSSTGTNNLVVSIIDINGSPPPSAIFVNGCRAADSVGGDC